jgi:sarcosine oxidase, subunit beta
VNSAGPLAGEVSALAGVDLPLTWELHLKAAFRDSARILPRHAPLVILADAQRIDWSEEEAELLRQTPDDRLLLELLPGGAHIRPEGSTESPYCVLLWPYRLPPTLPVFPIAPDPAYADVAMRGMSRLIPGLREYFTRMPPTTVDGGYYTRTPDNLPLIGPTPITGYFLMAAFSGFGVMGSPAAGELLAQSVAGQSAAWELEPFRLDRFEAPEYWERLRRARETGEL